MGGGFFIPQTRRPDQWLCRPVGAFVSQNGVSQMNPNTGEIITAARLDALRDTDPVRAAEFARKARKLASR